MEEVGKILPAAFKRRLRLGGPNLVEILASLWPRLVGKPIAQHSQPVAFDAGTLTLLTNCPSWAAQLQQMPEEIQAAINSFLGEPVVKKLVVRHAPNLSAEAPNPKPETRNWKVEPINSDLDCDFQTSNFDFRKELDPEIARIVQLSFSKYFSRNAKRLR